MSRIGLRRLGLAAGAVGLASALLVIPSGAHAAPTTIPGIKLMTGTSHVEVDRFGSNPNLFIQDPVYVAATNGAFEIDAVRHKRTISLHQVIRSGSKVKVVRTIKPIGVVHMEAGLPKFFTLTLKNTSGTVLATKQVSFCPAGGFDSQRVDPNSPSQPTYPQQCGDKLTHAMPWGIDQGWADGIFSNLRVIPSQVPDGNYPLTIAVSKPYQRQLHLSTKDATATVVLNIKSQGNGCVDICPPIVDGHYSTAAIRRAAIERAEQDASPQLRGARRGAAARAKLVSAGLPDMIALPAHDLVIRHANRSDKDYLGFGATIWDAGPGGLDVEGFRHNHKPTMQARQYVTLPNGKSVSFKIGTFEFDTRPGHDHWHLEDVARYTLLKTNGDTVVRSHKQSFCLAPTDPVNMLRKNALWNPDAIGLYSNCPTAQSLWLREALPVGWGDTYVQQAGGQAFNITGLPNGSYLIRVQVNPHGIIHEVTRSNNASYLKITLGGVPGSRTVTTVGPVSAPTA